MSSTDKTAILFFSRKVAQESKFKTFISGNVKKNQAFSEALICRAEKTLSATGLPVFHFHEGNQKGRTFGDRMANAYQEVFDLGYQSVIAVGNDSLDINNVDWIKLENQLSAGKAVLGSTVRGGAYLIGFTKAHFDKEQFAQLPWQSRKLFKSLEGMFSENNDVVLLKQSRDINTFLDIKAILKAENGNLHSQFIRLIKWILSEKTVLKINHGLEIITSPILIYSPFRAPPVQLSSL